MLQGSCQVSCVGWSFQRVGCDDDKPSDVHISRMSLSFPAWRFQDYPILSFRIKYTVGLLHAHIVKEISSAKIPFFSSRNLRLFFCCCYQARPKSSVFPSSTTLFTGRHQSNARPLPSPVGQKPTDSDARPTKTIPGH